MARTAHYNTNNGKKPTVRHSSKKSIQPVMNKNLIMGVRWVQDALGSMQAKVFDYKIGATNEDAAGCAWAEILLDGEQPSEITVAFTRRLEPGIRLLNTSKMGGTREIASDKGIPHLKVPVKWNQGKPWVTDKKDLEKRNIRNFEFFNESGAFMQVEISIVARYGKLFLVIQELYAGWAGLCTVAEAKNLGQSYVQLPGTDKVAVVLPLWWQSAYPGANYLKTWPKTGAATVRSMYSYSVVKDLSEISGAAWDPVDLDSLDLDPPSGGRVRGWCTFFNVDSNYGFILLPDGRTAFVHFADLPRNMIALQGGEPYEFRLGNGQKPGQLQAFEVTPIMVR